ncbi:unnamed protein product [Amoebophrya sp. A120]|nr:unnamed protein product [Amoebophrya sp. A120]|eukprot:GSA120T00009970001.1
MMTYRRRLLEDSHSFLFFPNSINIFHDDTINPVIKNSSGSHLFPNVVNKQLYSYCFLILLSPSEVLDNKKENPEKNGAAGSQQFFHDLTAAPAAPEEDNHESVVFCLLCDSGNDVVDLDLVHRLLGQLFFSGRARVEVGERECHEPATTRAE